jgi:hypothetical protein
VQDLLRRRPAQVLVRFIHAGQPCDIFSRMPIGEAVPSIAPLPDGAGFLIPTDQPGHLRPAQPGHLGEVATQHFLDTAALFPVWSGNRICLNLR